MATSYVVGKSYITVNKKTMQEEAHYLDFGPIAEKGSIESNDEIDE